MRLFPPISRGSARPSSPGRSYANEDWTFTIVDSPTVNAFAVPGGYVYVTRGLLALANSEAEVAAVIGHEIAHVTENHVEERQKRNRDAGIGVLVGTVLGGVIDGRDGLRKGIEMSSRVASGYVAQFSQKQEFEADERGIQYLVGAGYDPLAQARFLESMSAKAKVDAELSGKGYNPNRVDFFASHPATADRIRRATLVGNRVGGDSDGIEGRDTYLMMTAGLIYGDVPEQGYVRGRRFEHPELRFRFQVPPKFLITNSSRQVVAEGPENARFLLQGGGKATVPPERYVGRIWIPSLVKNETVDSVGEVRSLKINGLDAATVRLQVKYRGKPFIADLTVIVHQDRFHRLTTLSPVGRRDLRRALVTATESFSEISVSEAARMRPDRIELREVRRGDTVASLAEEMSLDRGRRQIFRAH